MLFMDISYILIDPIIVRSAPCRNLPGSSLQDHSIFSHITVSKTTLDGKNLWICALQMDCTRAQENHEGMLLSMCEQHKQCVCGQAHTTPVGNGIRCTPSWWAVTAERGDVHKLPGVFGRTHISSKCPALSATLLHRAVSSSSAPSFGTNQPSPGHSANTILGSTLPESGCEFSLS